MDTGKQRYASPMRILIADDEPLARLRLETLLRLCPDTELVGSVGSGQEVLEQLVVTHPDVVLLDIAMPGLDGVALTRRLSRLPSPPQVIFCTAYAQHALDAFQLHVADYLLKPVAQARLCEALLRAESLRQQTTARAPIYLSARVCGETIRISLDRVIVLRADDKYVAVQHEQGQALIEMSLKALEKAYPERFLRLHRRCLVPRERLLGLKLGADGRTLARLLGSDLTLQVSRRNLPTLRKFLRSE